MVRPAPGQVMFATIPTDTANNGDGATLEALLGVKRVDALHFASVIDGCQVRSFNGCSRETEQIKDALLARYAASVQEGLLPQLEPAGMRSVLKVNPSAALAHLLPQLVFPPNKHGLKMHMRLSTDRRVASEADAQDAAEELGQQAERAYGDLRCGPLASNDSLQEHPPLAKLQLPLHPEQARSLSWMVAREAEALPVVGQQLASADLGSLPPLQSLAVEWRLTPAYALRGGILADVVGFGKTAVYATPRPDNTPASCALFV